MPSISKRAKNERLLGLILPILAKERELTPEQRHRLEAALPEMKSRGSTLVALAEACEFLFG